MEKYKSKYDYIAHCQGRSASTAITKTLEKLSGSEVPHLHVLSQRNLDFCNNLYSNTSKTVGNKKEKDSYNLLNTIDMEKNKYGIKQKVVAAFRDPMDYLLSSFFSKHLPHIKSLNNIKDKDVLFEKVSVFFSKLIDLYMSESHSTEPEYIWPVMCFYWPRFFYDYEMLDPWNIDVFKENFDGNYKIYRTDMCDFLLLKFEYLDDIFSEAFYEFSDIKGVELSKNKSDVYSNSFLNKRFYKLRKVFVKEFNFSYDFIDKIYSEKYVSHFYSENEIDKFKKKWRK